MPPLYTISRSEIRKSASFLWITANYAILCGALFVPRSLFFSPLLLGGPVSDKSLSFSTSLVACSVGWIGTLVCIGIFDPPLSTETHSSMMVPTDSARRETSSESSPMPIEIAEPVTTEVVSAPTEPDYEALEPDPPSRYFDDGLPDPMSGRETAFKRWTTNHAGSWQLLDAKMQACVYIKYVNVGDNSPDRAIDECLTFFEGQP